MAFRNQSVSAHQFSMVPRADIPRAAFNIDFTHKTTLDAGKLIPIFCEEILPGDSWRVSLTAFARLSTPIVPIMDNLHMDAFFFFVPNRLVWDNWQRFMGERDNPDDTTDFLVPRVTIDSASQTEGSIWDYFGLPIGNINPTNGFQANALPFRGYLKIFNEWFRNQNLTDSVVVPMGDGPDLASLYSLQARNKRPDYFTSALPWPQKGESVSIPLGTSAPVVWDGNTNVPTFVDTTTGAFVSPLQATGGQAQVNWAVGNAPGNSTMRWSDPGLVADLTEATAATINQLRQSFQIQRLLERDARGGTRYTEIVRSHFGVVSPDARLQRPEYLGGSSDLMQIMPIPQSSGTAAAPGGYTDTPQGNLAAIGTVVCRGGFSQSFTEHGYVIGLVSVRADITYQQGMRRHWSRRSRYDYYFPAFAMLGEQAILSKEIYTNGEPAEDDSVFGYQERWSEYRYIPNQISGKFRSTSAAPLDVWHLAENFTARPTLSSEFVTAAPPVERILALGSQAAGEQFLFDSVFKCRVARPMPLYSVPGMIDHF